GPSAGQGVLAADQHVGGAPSLRGQPNPPQRAHHACRKRGVPRGACVLAGFWVRSCPFGLKIPARPHSLLCHQSYYRLLEPGEYVVSVYLTGVHASSLTSTRRSSHPIPFAHHQSCYRLLEPGEYVLSVYLTGVHAASLTGSRDEEKALRHLKFQLVGQYNVSAQVGGVMVFAQVDGMVLRAHVEGFFRPFKRRGEGPEAPQFPASRPVQRVCR
ncbi:unnamed protein product, partial [Closterium sp. NIES-54]